MIEVWVLEVELLDTYLYLTPDFEVSCSLSKAIKFLSFDNCIQFQKENSDKLFMNFKPSKRRIEDN